MISKINNMAVAAHRLLFWSTPYDTGNLARSVGDVGMLDNGIGFYMFNKNQVAPYGAKLNEQQIIHWKIVKRNGEVAQGSYNNKHYLWVDNAIEQNIIPNLCMLYGLRRVL